MTRITVWQAVLIGVIAGLFTALGAWSAELGGAGLPWSVDGVLTIHRRHPSLIIIDFIPLLLALLGWSLGSDMRGANNIVTESGLTWDAVERLPIGAAVVRRGGHVVAVNTTARRIFGLPDPLPDLRIYDLIEEPDPDKDESTRTRVGSTGTRLIQLWRSRGTHTDGTQFPVEFTFGPATEDGATLLYWIDDVGRADRREMALKDLHESSIAKNRFLATMSHELRTPMNAVIGYTEMVREDLQDAGQTEYVLDLDRILTAGRHLLGIINAVLDIAKIEAGRMTLVTEPVDVHAIIESLVITLEPLAQANGNRFEVRMQSMGKVIVDRLKLRQILVNLLGNSCKFTDHGTISITCSHNEDVLIIAVSDSGIGMTSDEAATVFDDFTQATRHTQQQYGGTGLGLSISRRMAKVMGGEIKLKSKQGSGSTFTVRLPAPLAESETSAESVDNPA